MKSYGEGAPYEAYPKTWNDLVEFAQKLNDPPDRYGLGMGLDQGTFVRQWYMNLLNQGGVMFDLPDKPGYDTIAFDGMDGYVTWDRVEMKRKIKNL